MLWLRDKLIWSFVRLYIFQKMIALDLRKQEALDANPKAIQQISFTANVDRAGNTRIYFIIEGVKEILWYYTQFYWV